MKTTAPNSENLEVRSEKRDQDSSFSLPSSHFSPHPPALVPKLRFPEFRGAEGWEKSPLGELMEITSSKRVHESEWTVSGVPFYRAREIVALNNMDPISPLYISEELYRENAKRSGEIVEGDLLVTGVGSIGIPYLVKGNDRFYFKDGNIIWLKNRGTKLLGRFLHLLYGTQFVQSQIKTMAGVGTVGTYTIDNANRTSVVFPTDNAEQQNIAECLSSVDELLAAQARKVDALKTHKKGLLQNLFPAVKGSGSENLEMRNEKTEPDSSFSIQNSNFSIPPLRFPEFQNAGEWVQKKVGDVSEVLMCRRIFAEETNPSEGVPFYKIGTLGGIPDAFISREKFEDYRSRYNYPRTGEVLITCSGTVGKCLPFDGKDSYFQDSNIVWLNNPNGDVSNEFLLMLLSNVDWGMLNSTTITRIYGPDLRGLAIKYPEDKSEQHRIASCLSSLDALITAETQKLDALKTHKRGLMQQLFPSPEEATP